MPSARLAAPAVLLLALLLFQADFARAVELQTLEIASKTGVHAFQVEPGDHARRKRARPDVPP